MGPGNLPFLWKFIKASCVHRYNIGTVQRLKPQFQVADDSSTSAAGAAAGRRPFGGPMPVTRTRIEAQSSASMIATEAITMPTIVSAGLGGGSRIIASVATWPRRAAGGSD